MYDTGAGAGGGACDRKERHGTSPVMCESLGRDKVPGSGVPLGRCVWSRGATARTEMGKVEDGAGRDRSMGGGVCLRLCRASLCRDESREY